MPHDRLNGLVPNTLPDRTAHRITVSEIQERAGSSIREEDPLFSVDRDHALDH